MSIKIHSSFTLQVYGWAGSIALVCLLLMVLTWLQGPRVRSVTLDANLVTTAENQQLLLHMNQPFGNINEKQVRITPEAPFAVTSSGNIVAIQFTQPLQNDSDYEVVIHTNDKHYTINYMFHTEAATFYYAVDSQSKTEIHKRVVGANVSQIVYTGDKIDDYLVLGNSLVLVVKENGKANLLLYDMSSKRSQHITLPSSNGTISQLRSTPSKHLFGLIYTDPINVAVSNILLYDVNTKQLRPVGFSQDHPLEVGKWQLARNGTTVLAQTPDFSTLIINSGATPIPLGRYSQIFGFSHDDSIILMRSATDGIVGLDIKNKQQRSLVKQASDTYADNVLPLFTKQGYIMQIQAPISDVWVQKVLVSQQNEQKILYVNTSADKYIDNVRLSPNDQLLAVEERVTKSDAHESRIISASDGGTLMIIEGNMVRWPSGL